MKATIADYGVGNLHSISKALERSGARTRIMTDMSKLADSECIVLPGVGAFGAATEKLRLAYGSLRSSVQSGTPMLGICLGMQLMFEKSAESRGDGLGLFKGEVKKLRAPRVPQIGWNDVTFDDDPLFDGVSLGSEFYFANSFVCHPEEEVVIGETEYGERFASAVRSRSVCGVQFHPEKSSIPGLKVLSNFVKIAEDAA